MISSLEQYEEAYAKASPTQKYLCSRSGDKLWSIATKHGIVGDARYTKFALIVGDVILGIQKIPDLHVILSQEIGLDEIGANKITRDLLDFMAPLSDPSWQPPKNDEPTELAAEVLAMEQALTNKYQPPQNEEPVYTSTQSAILREGASSTPAAPNEPRWDTAR